MPREVSYTLSWEALGATRDEIIDDIRIMRDTLLRNNPSAAYSTLPGRSLPIPIHGDPFDPRAISYNGAAPPAPTGLMRRFAERSFVEHRDCYSNDETLRVRSELYARARQGRWEGDFARLPPYASDSSLDTCDCGDCHGARVEVLGALRQMEDATVYHYNNLETSPSISAEMLRNMQGMMREGYSRSRTGARPDLGIQPPVVARTRNRFEA